MIGSQQHMTRLLNHRTGVADLDVRISASAGRNCEGQIQNHTGNIYLLVPLGFSHSQADPPRRDANVRTANPMPCHQSIKGTSKPLIPFPFLICSARNRTSRLRAETSDRPVLSPSTCRHDTAILSGAPTGNCDRSFAGTHICRYIQQPFSNLHIGCCHEKCCTGAPGYCVAKAELHEFPITWNGIRDIWSPGKKARKRLLSRDGHRVTISHVIDNNFGPRHAHTALD